MKEIPLVNGRGIALVDDEDFPYLSQMKWYLIQPQRACKYAHTKLNGRTTYMHRLVLGSPKGLEVDHIDNDGLNNQRANLRLATRGQNNMNIHSLGGKSKYRGVSRNGANTKWMAYIKKDGKQTHLGYFDSEIDAALAFDEMARVLFGDFSRLNFPDNPDRSALR
jgi:hypothetical protein